MNPILKKSIFTGLVIFSFFYSTSVAHAQEKEGMSNIHLQELIAERAQITKAEDHYWEFIYNNSYLIIVTDVANNRMRIISPIREGKSLSKKDMEKILSANFNRALDAKYALFKGFLWSTYTHPFKELTDDQFADALAQVKSLVDNYGSSYTSTDLIFGGRE